MDIEFKQSKDYPPPKDGSVFITPEGFTLYVDGKTLSNKYGFTCYSDFYVCDYDGNVKDYQDECLGLKPETADFWLWAKI